MDTPRALKKKHKQDVVVEVRGTGWCASMTSNQRCTDVEATGEASPDVLKGDKKQQFVAE